MSAPLIADLEREIAELQDLKTPALQIKWRTVFASEPPRKMRAGFLARAIAYRLQEQVLGTLRPDTQKTLDKLALSLRRSQGDDVGARNSVTATPNRHLSPGTRLMREWNGTTELVDVVETGFVWRGKSYRTLSAVAVAITGTKWSGPKFFGLDRSPKRSVRRDHRSAPVIGAVQKHHP